ncbi:MAG: 2-C-methyl-D-erythritol 4-phosphate cytidylyltransferase [Chthoniobacterales bacterium]
MASAAAIVVAGGSSQRMGFDKLRADLNGSPVYRHSLRTLQDCPEIGQIVLVASQKNLAEFQSETTQFPKLTHVLPGGTERHFSVAAGLEKVAAEFHFIAVHDAARPLLSPRDLLAVLAAARTHGAASLATPVTDTLKRTDADGFVQEPVDRTHLWAMQTPQVFQAERLRAAYQKILAVGDIVTDEVSAVAKQGDRVKLVPAQDPNFKITYSCDIALARLALTSLSLDEKVES